jgi:glutaconyl-CoA/methylmalonyl-CoA decarboxylase subunit gamma
MKKLKVTVDGRSYAVEVEALDSPESGDSPVAAPAPSSGAAVESPLAGKIVEVQVAVQEGDTLLVLEAMKMNTLVSSTASGSVVSINVGAGDMVEEGQALLTIG